MQNVENKVQKNIMPMNNIPTKLDNATTQQKTESTSNAPIKSDINAIKQNNSVNQNSSVSIDNKPNEEISLQANSINIEQDKVKTINPPIYTLIKNWWVLANLKVKIYILAIIIPSLLFLFYNLFIASPMYISEAKFAIRSMSTSSGGFDFASQIFNVPTTSSQEARIVEDYLKSPDIIFAINKNIDLLSHYTNSKYDFFSRLNQNPTLNDIVNYWKDITLVKVNKDSNVITFSIRAYDPKIASDIVTNALSQCEKLVNSMNERARQDALLLSKNELEVAKNKFDEAQNNIKEFRNQHKDLDLKSTATGFQGLIIELEGQATALRTQISESLSYMKEDAPAIKSLRSRLQGVEKQLEIEKQKITSLSQTGESINTLAGLYEALTIDLEFARKQLEFAMTAYEKAKIEVMSQNLYVVNIAKPSSPDESLYPETFKFSLYFFIALNLGLAIISVVIAAVKEHMGI